MKSLSRLLNQGGEPELHDIATDPEATPVLDANHRRSITQRSNFAARANSANLNAANACASAPAHASPATVSGGSRRTTKKGKKGRGNKQK